MDQFLCESRSEDGHDGTFKLYPDDRSGTCGEF